MPQPPTGWAAGLVMLAAIVGIIVGSLSVYASVQKSACERWGGTYSSADPNQDRPAVCWSPR